MRCCCCCGGDRWEIALLSSTQTAPFVVDDNHATIGERIIRVFSTQLIDNEPKKKN